MLYDVIVAGGGHAGLEAALAAARLGARTLLVTLSRATVGVLSCNPAFGGPAKGGLVREVDALGGFCGFMADLAARQCRTLGESKGPAARSTRFLVDRLAYCRGAQEYAARQPNLAILEGEAAGILTGGGRATGLKLADGRVFRAGAVALCGGTFWRAVTWRGQESCPAGRRGEAPANFLSLSLASLGHRVGRLSTCTAPRIKAATARLEGLERQPGDPTVRPFSTLHDSVASPLCCYLTWTNPRTHAAVAAAMGDSIFYHGGHDAAPPRYCPSIEDKVHNFPGRQRHAVFLEPDGEGVIFPSGLPTGLAPAAQLAMLRTIEGLEGCELAWPGYAIEYDYGDPRDLGPDFQSLKVKGLFLAGQVNGTSGYEEAAAQGLLAGLNAARLASGDGTVTLGRGESLLGVLADDLTSRGVTEPYRMFTSRAEYRLLLREDNADLRLSPLAEKWGLLDAERARRLRRKRADMAAGQQMLAGRRLTPAEAKSLGVAAMEIAEPMAALELLKRPAASLALFRPLLPALDALSPRALDTLETEVKFAGYISRQEEEVARLAKEEATPLPPGLDYMALSGLSTEVRETLARHRPATLGRAGRLPGVTPAALSVLGVWLRQRRGRG